MITICFSVCSLHQLRISRITVKSLAINFSELNRDRNKIRKLSVSHLLLGEAESLGFISECRRRWDFVEFLLRSENIFLGSYRKSF